MRIVESRSRFGNGSEMFFGVLAAVLVLAAALLLVFPARALAAPATLSITKQGPTRVEPGERFDYVLTVSNAADAQPANNVKVEDTLPPDVTFDESEAPAGVNCADAAGTVTCTVPSLAAGESKTITLKVRALSTGKITNRATASSPDDTNSPVRSNEVTTTVAPKLLIKKLDEPDPVKTRAVLTYTIRVQNGSQATAQGVAVTDELPLDKVDFLSVDSHDFDCHYTAGIIQCGGGVLGPGEIGKVEIAVKTDKAGTLQNRADVFVEGIRESLGSDTASTKVGGTGGGGGGGGDDGGGGNPNGRPVPTGDQCSPVINRDTGKPAEVITGTDPLEGTFYNDYDGPLPLRIAYATSSENGTLTITVTRKGNGKTVLDKTIKGKKTGVVEVDTDAGATYDVAIVPDNQGYAVDLQIGSGTEKCTNPEDLNPPAVSGGGGNGGGGNGGGNGSNDVIDDTVSDRPLPATGGASLLGLAVISLAVAVVGGATVVRTGVRRRDG